LTLTSFPAAFGPRAHIVPLIARLALAALFIIAGALKLGHADDLASVISAFSLGFPAPLVAFIAVALPPFEILLGIYLAGGWFLPETSMAATVLMVAFIAAIASVVARGITAPCGCFGSADTAPATWATVLRDVLFVIPAAYLAWWSRANARLRAEEP
jgi:uncharacterized membrane protein YphA (DoxX/SURF4 family)